MIRSLTIGLPLDGMSTAEIESRVRRLLRDAANVLGEASVSARTFRFTLPACGMDGEDEGALLSRLRWTDELACATGVRWFCLPLDFVAPGPRRGRIAAALDAVGRFERLFLNLMVAGRRRIAVDAVNDASRLILDLSRKSSNGFDNFRVGASFNCPANAPFFPFSRHEGANVAFSLALETTSLACEAVRACGKPQDADVVRDCLVEALIPALRSMDIIGERLATVSGSEYRGLDASLAPLPADGASVAALVQQIIGAPLGSHASVFATAFLTDAIRTAITASGVKPLGFNGVMYSVLEDTVLAASVSQRHISFDGLLALSTVCACGLDMIPVPGLSFPEEISAVMLDVGAISCALDKPLGVRLLPIPNGCVNEFTRLNLDFLCDSRILGLTSNDRRFGSAEHLVGFRSHRH